MKAFASQAPQDHCCLSDALMAMGRQDWVASSPEPADDLDAAWDELETEGAGRSVELPTK